LVWVAFGFWGLDCLQIEEEKGWQRLLFFFHHPVSFLNNLFWVAFAF
jgi:hypothetical protein